MLKRIQGKFSDLFHHVQEVLSNMHIVKAFAKEEEEDNKFKVVNKTIFEIFYESRVLFNFKYSNFRNEFYNNDFDNYFCRWKRSSTKKFNF